MGVQASSGLFYWFQLGAVPSWGGETPWVGSELVKYGHGLSMWSVRPGSRRRTAYWKAEAVRKVNPSAINHKPRGALFRVMGPLQGREDSRLVWRIRPSPREYKPPPINALIKRAAIDSLLDFPLAMHQDPEASDTGDKPRAGLPGFQPTGTRVSGDLRRNAESEIKKIMRPVKVTSTWTIKDRRRDCPRIDFDINKSVP